MFISKLVSIYVHRLLQKARLKRNNAVVIRDSLRNEMSKRSKTEEENREKREQLASSFVEKCTYSLVIYFI